MLCDLRDDESAIGQIQSMIEEQGLPDFDADACSSEKGYDKVVETLAEWGRWLHAQDQRLVAFDLDGDTWCAVVVRDAFADEFVELSERLGLAPRDGVEWFSSQQ